MLRSTALRIALGFAAFGVSWILLSDSALEALTSDPATRATLQSVKGIVFVLLSTTLVYVLVASAERRHSGLNHQLRDERDRLSSILNVNPAVIYSMRVANAAQRQFVVTFIGERIVSLTGHPIECWYESPDFWRTHLHPDDAPAAMARQQELLDTGSLMHEYRFRHAQGHYIWIQDNLLLARDDSGQTAYIMGAWLDVTHRKEIQAQLTESEERYRLLFNANPQPLWLLDVHSGTPLSVNHAALQQYGYTEAEFLSLKAADLRSPGEVARMKAYLDAIPPDPHLTLAAGEWLHRRKDGSECWVEVHLHQLTLQGRLCMLVLATDVTARRQEQEHRRIIAHMFDTTQDGMFILGRDKTFLSVNPAFTRITGFNLDELLAHQPDLIRSDQLHPSDVRSMWLQLDAVGRWSGEVWLKPKSGEDVPVWINASAIRDADQTVIQYLGVITDTSSAKAAEARIQQLANYDSLTSLPNRTLLYDRAKVAFASARRSHNQVTLMHLNVDHFKAINEQYGHDIGDEVLRQVALRLQASLKPDDTVCRLGGDNFVILLPHIAALSAGKIAMRLLASVAESMPLAPATLEVTACIGLAEYPDNGTDLAELMQAAETAVSHAKRDGRSSVGYFNNALREELLQALSIERDLQHAVERGELVLHYQPQIDVRSRRLVGLEALVRWQHPERGMVPPGRFIPVAEQTGLIRKVGDWVMNQALRDMQAWQQAGFTLVPVAVNLSLAQFRHKELCNTVQAAITASGLAPELLELELTESIAMDDSEFTVTTIDSLKRLGVTLSIDDFGTGYSSLSYLKRYAVDKLKIDQSFVRGLNQDAEDEAIVRAVISMAKTLGLRTVAEGVETDQQAAFLRASGCDVFQGYLFSRPVPEQAIRAWLAGDTPLA